jgi:ATP-dependent DNA ligase
LLERKRRLLAVMPSIECRVLYLDHLAQRGRDLFRVACERDLEGIVGKWAHGTYQTTGAARRG